MINNLSIKINKNKIEKEKEKEKKISNFNLINNLILNSQTNNDNFETKYNFSEKNIFYSKINKNKKVNFFLLNKTHFKNNNNYISKDNKKENTKENINVINLEQKNNISMDNLSLKKPLDIKLKNKLNNALNIVSLQKELITKLKHLEEYKSKYESYKTRLEFLHNKYNNIIKIFDEALEKIYKENELNKIDEISINIDELKKSDFNKLTPEQKYSIVNLLIKFLLPLVNIDNLPDNLKSNLKKINTRFYLNDNNNSIYSNNSLSTTVNGKIYNNSKTSKIKRIIEFTNNTQKIEKCKSPKKIIHNLDIDGYSSYSNSAFYSPKIQNKINYNLKNNFLQGFPNINNYPKICHIKSVKKE